MSKRQHWMHALFTCVSFALSTTIAAAADPAQKRWLGEFPPYPGAVEWCSGCTMGPRGSGNITWTNFATVDPVDKVQAFYRKFNQSKDNIYRVVVEGKIKKTLSAAQAATGNYPECKQKLAPGVQTIISVSIFSTP